MIGFLGKTSQSSIEFFDVRHRALRIAALSVSIGGMIGVIIHFFTKGSTYWGVPLVGTLGASSSFIGIWASQKYRSVKLGGAIASVGATISMLFLVIFTDGLRSALLPMLCGLPGFAALFWGPRGALWVLGTILSLLAGLGLAEVFNIMPHNYFGPYPDLQNAGAVVAVFNAIMMVGGTGFFYVREQNSIKHLIWDQTSKAQRAEEAKSQFLANMTHELRTPLNGITGMAQLIKLEKTTPSQMEYLDSITQSARELEALIDNLLIAASQTKDEDKSGISPESLIEVIGLNPNDFKVSYSGNAGKTPMAIETIKNTIDLMTRAAWYRRSKRPIEVFVSVDAAIMKWEIEDQGVPITPELFERCLATFDRTINQDGELSSNAQLGLGFAKELAERIGASVSYEPKGKQNFFVLTLPLGQ